MSRKPEQKLWDRMRKALGKQVRLERVENAVGTGRPDVDALVNGLFTPIELKMVEVPPVRPTTPVLGEKAGLRLDQRNWHLDWRRWGGRSMIIVGVEARIYAFGGWCADEINGWNIEQFERNALANTWDGVARLLSTGGNRT